METLGTETVGVERLGTETAGTGTLGTGTFTEGGIVTATGAWTVAGGDVGLGEGITVGWLGAPAGGSGVPDVGLNAEPGDAGVGSCSLPGCCGEGPDSCVLVVGLLFGGVLIACEGRIVEGVFRERRRPPVGGRELCVSSTLTGGPFDARRATVALCTCWISPFWCSAGASARTPAAPSAGIVWAIEPPARFADEAFSAVRIRSGTALAKAERRNETAAGVAGDECRDGVRIELLARLLGEDLDGFPVGT